MLIAAAVFAALLVGGMIYYRYSSVQGILNIPVTDSKQSLTGGSVEGRVTTIEDALALLINRVNNLSPTTTQTATTPNQVSGDINSRVQSLENTVANLQVQINQLKGGETSPTTISGSRSPVYIPLGWNGSASTQDWSSVTSQSISIDPADYSGYTSMQFEANISVYQGNGTAYARLFNSTDALAIIPSEVSGKTDTPTWVSSATFQLPSTTKKTYVLQVKTTTGYASQVQNARIKVNF